VAAKGKRIGLYGGTFDPVHNAHLQAALEAAEQANLDEVRLIPAAHPPHRQAPKASAAQRLAMLQLAASDEPRFVVDDRELLRAAPSYSIDSIESLRAECAENDLLFWLLGEDAFCGLPGWHRFDELIDSCHFLVWKRPDSPPARPEVLRQLLARRAVAHAADIRKRAGQIGFIEPTALALSATQIRARRASGRSVRFLLPAAVLDYIETEGLYLDP